MKEPNFWDDKRESERVISNINSLKNTIDKVKNLKEKITNNFEIVEELKNFYDEELVEMISNDIEAIGKELDEVEVLMLLSGPYDKDNAIVEIHSGAGGTEACDWANMLYRMYTRWCEKKNYKVEVIDSQPGEEVGIKSLTMFVKGMNAFGYLKNEKGVHRLVRISPFDSNARRHTSFASIDVTPLIENSDIKIEINPSDIRVDVYRSSGCGGQGVNTTDSAVRITHFPTKMVVTCQNERSQIQNKEKAMEVLKSKLYQLEMEKRNNELKELKGNQNDINFGSQIRSYVMCPYSMVKDHRTNVETSNVDKVLDGDIDLFINASLKEVKK
jgi:peptide chain release factor 2